MFSNFDEAALMINSVRLMTQYILSTGLSICFLAHMVQGDVMKSSALDVRQLQTNQTLNYRATYKADFQHLRDFQCVLSEPPVLELTCFGSVMTIVNISDPFILCSKLDDSNINNGTTYQCTTNCTDCLNVYENFGAADDERFGSIEFMCEGNDYRQVDADYIFTSGNDGQCDSRSDPVTRNYHVARLGVSCPTTSSDRKYVYDDTYVECTIGGSASPGFPLDLSLVGEEDVYFCITGDNCLGIACTVPFDEIRIRATLPSFLDDCVDRLVPITPFPTNAPIVSNSMIEYTIQYEASWGQLFDSVSSRQICQTSNPTILISCDAGATIKFLNSTDSSMVCISIDSNDLSCTGSATFIDDNFTSVAYNCAGPRIPLSRVFFPGSTTDCSGNSLASTVTHAVTMGIRCEFSPSAPTVYYTDWAAECDDVEHDFENLVGEYGLTIARYTCRESTTFMAGSTAVQAIRNVSISTDPTFQENPEGCFTSSLVPSSPTAALPVTPTLSPITSIPSASPIVMSKNPSVSPSGTTVQPVGITPNDPVIASPVVAPSSATSSNNDTPILGIAIGCVGGGFALAALLAMMLFIKNRGPSGGGGTAKPGIGSSPNLTEFGNNNDFTSSSYSRSAATGSMSSSLTSAHVRPSQVSQPQLPPFNEKASSKQQADGADSTAKPNISLYLVSPETPYQNVASTPASRSSSRQKSYPTNHVVDVKDQCRSVAPVRSSSPTFISPQVVTNHIPVAVALDVTSTATVPSLPSHSSRTKQEPKGRTYDA